MRVQTTCPQPQCRHEFTFTCTPETGSVTCPRCGHETPLSPDAIHVRGGLVHCPCCRCDELFLRKDFPQKLGLSIVIASALVSVILFARGWLLWSLGILLGVVLVDLIIYAIVPKITVCYRCRSTFRDVSLNPDHHGFDLATAEKYRGLEME